MELTADEMRYIVYGLRELGIQYNDDAFGDFNVEFINSLIEKFRKEIKDEIQRNRNQ